MPFKSEAQRRLFYAKARRGEMSPATIKKWEKHTPDKKLQERVKTAAAIQNEAFAAELIRLLGRHVAS